MSIQEDVEAVLDTPCCATCREALALGETYQSDDEDGLPHLREHKLRWLERSDGDREWQYRCDRDGWHVGTVGLHRLQTIRECAPPALLRALEGLR